MTEYRDRLQIVHSAGVPVSQADAQRVLQSVQVSLLALDAAVKSSLFDTEPQTFDVVLRKLAKSKSHD
ncbi:MAG: hypothetical protein SFW09_09170 [Hyphomicrobiaceae bacterium]|nr:hypothetical protein [Hyphomicrobiaceae bacterium]